MVKWIWSSEQAQVLIGMVKKQARVKLDGNLLIKRVTPAKAHKLSYQAFLKVKAWCRKTLIKLQCRAKDTGVKMTLRLTQLLKMVLAVMVSDTHFQCCTGVQLSLGHASIDQIVPDRGYTVKNARLLYWPINALKGQCRTDVAIKAAVEQISPAAVQRAEDLHARGVKVPRT